VTDETEARLRTFSAFVTRRAKARARRRRITMSLFETLNNALSESQQRQGGCAPLLVAPLMPSGAYRTEAVLLRGIHL
jgi:hypothetical protein